eukprot:TRINITY_DN1808_c0_g2_i1.p1 TRINITY_DN1808_c0_g2~~TRINITY_DN1808_c0_g2_i1.p1  ORF type:complete len:576 (-),score=70.29 TRINITY_DN1808_c0_g2_i1:82-1809(-)
MASLVGGGAHKRHTKTPLPTTSGSAQSSKPTSQSAYNALHKPVPVANAYPSTSVTNLSSYLAHRFSYQGALKGSAFYTTLGLLFVVSWLIIFGPALLQSNDARLDTALITVGKTQLRLRCGDPDVDTSRTQYEHKQDPNAEIKTIIVSRRWSQEAIERVIAEECHMSPPLVLKTDEGAIVPMSGSLGTAPLWVHPTHVSNYGLQISDKTRSTVDYAMDKEALIASLKGKRRSLKPKIGLDGKPEVQRVEVQFKIPPGVPGPRQMNPPPDTDDIIYPKPMRKPEFADGNITYLAGAINIGRRMHAGKRPEDYKFEDDYLQVMRLILSWKKPTMLIIQRKYYQFVEDVIHDQAIIHFVEIEDLRNWKYYEGIERIRRTKDWQQISSWIPDSPQAYSDLYNPVIMRKIYWLQELCEMNPFGSKFFMWVDSGICSVGLTANKMDYLGRRYAQMMEPGFLATNSPRDGGDEIQGFWRWKLEEMVGGHVSYLTKGGTFGGTCPRIKDVVELYDNALDTSLKEGFLGTEESIFTIAYYKRPEIFHEFKQERVRGQEHLCLMNDMSYHHPAFKDPDDPALLRP